MREVQLHYRTGAARTLLQNLSLEQELVVLGESRNGYMAWRVRRDEARSDLWTVWHRDPFWSPKLTFVATIQSAWIWGPNSPSRAYIRSCWRLVCKSFSVVGSDSVLRTQWHYETTTTVWLLQQTSYSSTQLPPGRHCIVYIQFEDAVGPDSSVLGTLLFSRALTRFVMFFLVVTSLSGYIIFASTCGQNHQNFIHKLWWRSMLGCKSASAVVIKGAAALTCAQTKKFRQIFSLISFLYSGCETSKRKIIVEVRRKIKKSVFLHSAFDWPWDSCDIKEVRIVLNHSWLSNLFVWALSR